MGTRVVSSLDQFKTVGNGAGDGNRTRDLDLGKVALYR
ncbi:uncharacterized protein METZ01_LOCUS388383 [marine metagenome]|uniref:Uncharacterized protein n=1 Tax=marine metagenome TaxID=408172 RepID=A0A382UMN9_9ZZZZ